MRQYEITGHTRSTATDQTEHEKGNGSHFDEYQHAFLIHVSVSLHGTHFSLSPSHSIKKKKWKCKARVVLSVKREALLISLAANCFLIASVSVSSAALDGPGLRKWQLEKLVWWEPPGTAGLSPPRQRDQEQATKWRHMTLPRRAQRSLP